MRSVRQFLIVVSSLLSLPAFAALPTIDAPTNTAAGTGLMGTLVGYGFDGIKWMGVILVAAALVKIGAMFIGALHEIHIGKKTWGDAGFLFLAGVICIVAIIWLVTKSTATMTA